MTPNEFSTWLDEIYAIFGKNFPGARIANAIYRRVESLPDDFMRYAVSRIQDMDKLPANLGAFLKNGLWPDYMAAYPDKFTHRYEQPACPKCKYNSPGMREFYEADGTPRLCACDCCTDERLIRLAGKYSDEQLLAAGYFLERPAQYVYERKQNLFVNQAIRGAQEPVRQNHRDYLESIELD